MGVLINTMSKLVDVNDERGEKMSPTLPEGMKNLMIDIDGTVCEDVPNEEPWRMESAGLYEGVVEIINGWYEEGHIITFFTSRLSEHPEVTEAWLDKHGFQYHGVLYNKPRGGNYHWIDNHTVRATRFEGKFTNFVKKTLEVEVFEE